MMTRRVLRHLGRLSVLLAVASAAHAGGPRFLDTNGDAVGWSTAGVVEYVTDDGSLGALTHAGAVSMTEAAADQWTDVSTSSIVLTRAGDLGTDVDASNFGAYLGPYGGATSPLGVNAVVYDADGSIFDALYGLGNGVLGFANTTWFSDGVTDLPVGSSLPPGSVAIEGIAFLNGKYIDGINAPGNSNREVPLLQFEGVFVHELGHFLGLDHTQIHGQKLAPELDSYLHSSPIETMYPYSRSAASLSDPADDPRTPERDDRVALSNLYPAPGYAASTGRISGTLRTSSSAPFTGANVIARNVADDADAVSTLTGRYGAGAGDYVLAGLTPGASYRIQVEEVDVFHGGGSSLGGMSVPMILPGPPESYSGASESADPAVDAASSYTLVVPAAGSTQEDIDVVLNSQRFSVSNVQLPEDAGILHAAVGDFDGDGYDDFVGISALFADGANLYLRFHRGLGTGAFAPPVNVTTVQARRIFAGQFNGGADSHLDVAVVTENNEIRVLFGDGTGAFPTSTAALARPDLAGGSIVIAGTGGLDGDAVADLFALAVEADGSSTAYALLGSPGGAFSPVATSFASGVVVPRGNNYLPTTALIGQFAGSPHADVAGLDRDNPTLGLLVGDGTGGFTAAPVSLSGISEGQNSFGRAIASGDFNEDGLEDFVFQHSPVGFPPNYGRTYMGLLVNGGGSVSLAVRYPVKESFQMDVVAADFNGDGHLDMGSTGFYATAGLPGAKINVFYGDGEGDFPERVEVWGVSELPNTMAVGDFDDDGLPDLVLTDNRGLSQPVDTLMRYSVLINGDALCGNGDLEGDEDCDDGNLVGGDGCEADCIPTGCGDGVVAGAEQCDDGNNVGGDCCSRGCRHEPALAPCGDPADSACDGPDTCDGAGTCTSNFEPTTTSCGDPTDTACDDPDTCDGAGNCASNFEPTTTSCGDPTDTACDDPDTCDGAGNCASNLEPPTTSCGDPTDTACDDPDTCDGAGNCASNLEPPTTSCGDPTDTACDDPDTCDGAGNCAANLAPASTACGNPVGTLCDKPDTCDGAGTCLANYEPAATACGSMSETDCDHADTCDGAGNCLWNREPAGASCGDPSDTECDDPDTCDGFGGCVPNRAAYGASCGDPSDTDCDDPDTCDGAGDCVPNPEPPGAACGDPSASACDAPDTCNGAGACLANFAPPLAACGDPSNTACDAPDTCDGSGACLPNHASSSVACGDATDTPCSNPDTCDGAGHCSPNDESPSVACGDPSDTDCDDPDRCDGAGNCAANPEPAGVVCGDSSDSPCDHADTCDGAGTCMDNLVPDNTSCHDPSVFCEIDARCFSGQCLRLPRTCDDDDACTFDHCDETEDECVSVAAPRDPETCLLAAQGQLQVADLAGAARDKIAWRWSAGEAFAQDSLGDPAAGGTSYTVCVYDRSGSTPAVAATLVVPPSDVAWAIKAPKGMIFKSRDGRPQGVTKLQLRTGEAGRTRLKLAAKGDYLALPGAAGSTYFVQDPSVLVQLVNSEGTCWSSEFEPGDTTSHTDESFKAKVR